MAYLTVRTVLWFTTSVLGITRKSSLRADDPVEIRIDPQIQRVKHEMHSEISWTD
jgi:hypothetical protein